MAEAFAEGRLKEDLYYRLAEAVVTVPPLSERENDTLEIAERAVAELNALTGTDKALSDELRERLRSYTWPGNVVELKNTLRAAYAGTEPDEEIEIDKVFVPALSDGSADPAALLVGNSFWDVEKKLLLATLEFTGRQQAPGGQAPRHQPQDALQPSARLRLREARRCRARVLA